MLILNRKQQLVDLRSYGSFDGSFRKNNSISYYDIYCRLDAYESHP